MELSTFILLCNVFRRFVPNFERITTPPNGTSRMVQPLVYTEFSDEELEVLNKWKTKLSSPLLLTLPRLQGPYTAHTDAYDRQIGCVLFKKQPDGHEKPIGFDHVF